MLLSEAALDIRADVKDAEECHAGFGHSIRPDGCLVLWHSTNADFATFSGPWIHAGTLAQALMRGGRIVLELSVDPGKFSRRRDRGAWPRHLLVAASRRLDSIRYLNRFEGIDFNRLCSRPGAPKMSDLDRLTDRAFRRSVPEAADSWIIFDPSRIEITRRHDRMSMIKSMASR